MQSWRFIKKEVKIAATAANASPPVLHFPLRAQAAQSQQPPPIDTLREDCDDTLFETWLMPKTKAGGCAILAAMVSPGSSGAGRGTGLPRVGRAEMIQVGVSRRECLRECTCVRESLTTDSTLKNVLLFN
jgi:hypothetical protein